MSNAVTSSVALTELKNDLTRLSKTLHVIYDLMNTDMRQVGEAWQDGKYQEFVDGYKPQIDKCEEISVRYNDWCQRVLNPTIENVIAVEKTDVGGGSGAGAAVGGATVASTTATTGKANGFNMNNDGRSVVPRPQTNNDNPTKIRSNGFNMSGKTPTNANEACKADFGDGYKAVPASANDPDAGNLYVKSTQRGSDWSAGGKAEAGIKVGPGNIGIGGDVKYNSGNETMESIRNVPSFKCIPEK